MQHTAESFRSGSQAAENGLSPKDKWRLLAKLFHTDKQGDHDLMVALNLAKEDWDKTGDPKKINTLYAEWCTNAGSTQEIKPDPSDVVLAELQRFSDSLFNDKRAGRTKIVYPAPAIRNEYRRLCRAAGLKGDPARLNEFLYSQGWITKEEHDKGTSLEVFG